MRVYIYGEREKRGLERQGLVVAGDAALPGGGKEYVPACEIVVEISLVVAGAGHGAGDEDGCAGAEFCGFIRIFSPVIESDTKEIFTAGVARDLYIEVGAGDIFSQFSGSGGDFFDDACDKEC